jgi:hypothetical protein
MSDEGGCLKAYILGGVATLNGSSVALAGRRGICAGNSTGSSKDWQSKDEGGGDASEHVCLEFGVVKRCVV